MPNEGVNLTVGFGARQVTAEVADSECSFEISSRCIFERHRSNTVRRRAAIMIGKHVLYSVPVILLCLVNPGSLTAQVDWDEEAKRVESLMEEMTRKADSLQADLWLGTRYNEWHIPVHTCSILGRMLGMSEQVTHLVPALPDDDADESEFRGEEFRLAAHSLYNWLHTLELLRGMSEARRVREWNLDCAGELGIPATASIAESTEEAFFLVSEDGRRLDVIGAVTEGYHARLVAALDANPMVTAVALGSGGGLVIEAMRAGAEIRRRGLSTTLWNNCYSACPLVFLGGDSREIWSPYPQLGFHQIRDSAGSVPLTAPIYRRVAEYAKAMGVDDRALLRLLASAPPEDMASADPKVLCQARIATWIQRWCSAPGG